VLPLEVVGLMVTLLLVVIEPPPGPIQLIITELDSTPLTVLTVQLITRGLPTIAPCMGPDGDIVTLGTIVNQSMSNVQINNIVIEPAIMFGGTNFIGIPKGIKGSSTFRKQSTAIKW